MYLPTIYIIVSMVSQVMHATIGIKAYQFRPTNVILNRHIVVNSGPPWPGRLGRHNKNEPQDLLRQREE